MILLIHPSPDNKSYIPEIINSWMACRLANLADIGAKELGYNIF